ncbi:SubName: Full=Uncharacterized protein {ECO:0000313/EMBL:CCA75748.1} [Serendipita indica DSM 11827]|uniref:Epoxide hydrolase n=1 Tax=Serendipita indica (strain DSM 11827) TaxID=1109443 RepID=G4TWQ5_SERID|nr:SubName: Full=Uncharacterized protein {ECO:0000313/EMBL:CCA75748.1} [Serendipita indica DSM 11827]CCA75748.1 hypothetical protein PIIN_09738 [Serendipita indica DSM 11827]
MPVLDTRFKGICFDIGGVVITSPLIAIAQYERERGFPRDWLNVLITGHGHGGSWQRFERGEIDLYTFYDGFGRDLSDVRRGKSWYAQYCTKKGWTFPTLPPSSEMKVDGRELFGRMMRGSQFDDLVVRAIKIIRATRQYRVVAITNNFAGSTSNVDEEEKKFLGWDGGAASTSLQLRALFDDYIDSSEVGLRKPDPAIYKLACERNSLKPQETIMLDDLGMNLKPAKELGMTTIQVNIGRSEEAVRKLGELLALDLLDGGAPMSRL